MNANIAILLPIASICAGCVLLYVAWKSYATTRNMKQWEITQGTITKSSVKQVEAAWIPDIEYQYFVLGVEYKGGSVTIPPDVIYDVEVAQSFLEEYPVGKRVNVFYNPEVPRVAVLEKQAWVGIWWILFLVMGTALFFLILGFAFLLV